MPGMVILTSQTLLMRGSHSPGLGCRMTELDLCCSMSWWFRLFPFQTVLGEALELVVKATRPWVRTEKLERKKHLFLYCTNLEFSSYVMSSAIALLSSFQYFD